MGMALAERLSAAGHQVDVLEREPQLGGLATHHDFGGFYWDRFYHVILPSDRHLIQFLNQIGLGDELRWQTTRTGFFVDHKMHSISSNFEFLRFPLLSLIDKMRLAWTMVYSSRISDWRKLESVTVSDWLIRVSGRRTYQKMWKPLLLAKLGKSYERVSAVFIWSYIKRLFSARDASASKESLGHVSGGYKMVFERLAQRISAQGGVIATGVSVTSVRPAIDGGMDLEVENEATPRHYDKVICTSPVPVLRRIAGADLVRIANDSADVEYLGVVCAVVTTREPIVPFYVVNIADEAVPFTGIIGMSTVVDPQHTAGRHLTYLPKYVLSDDEWLRKDDTEVEQLFRAGLQRILPDFDQARIESFVINRAVRVQPLQVLNFSKLVPEVSTLHEDFLVLNTAQFVNATLNNNEVIGQVDRFISNHQNDFNGGRENGAKPS